MTTAGNSKSLKGQNRWHLWLLIAMNAAAFYAALNFGDFESSGFRALVDSATQLLPVGLATVVTTIANGLLSADTKARLVFLRWHHALPGNRAFSRYAQRDPRIDQARLAQLIGIRSLPTPEAEMPHGTASTRRCTVTRACSRSIANSCCCATTPVLRPCS